MKIKITEILAKRLQKRTIIITGAARGLGAATAKRLAAEGANVVINDISIESLTTTQKEIEADGGKCAAVAGDVSTSKCVAELMEKAKAFGGVDVMVNNAGVTRDSMMHKLTEEKFDEVLRINVKGSFLCAQAAAAQMVAKGQGGRIINFASVAALGNIGQVNYSASKAAVVGMTRTMALELARAKITVNAIAPGFFVTPMTDAIPADVKEKFVQKIPLRRMGNPDEIASLIAFLASDEASYITGQTFYIDGGLTVGVSGV